jgi:TRAP-type uncharacterized transport system substrate-binding protein
MRVSVVLALLLALGPLAVGVSSAQPRQKGPQPAKAQPFSHQAEREKANENLLMVLGGTLGGPWIHMAQDVALAVADGDKLRVLPLAGGGAKMNLRDVLLVRGLDLGITRLDVINDAKVSGEFGPNLERRIAYIAPLAVDMLQVLARPELNSLKDLHGKKMNILPKGSIVPSILKTLGIEIDEVNLTIPDGIQQMRTGEIYATACVCSVPIPAYAAVSADLGFKLLEVPYTAALEESFLPANLTSELYPNLIAKGSRVQTVGTHLLLVTYNWTPGSERYRKIEKFVNAFFTNFDKLRQPPRHPSWKNVNIAASVRGWQRFPAAQQWLDRQATEVAAKALPPGVDLKQARAQAVRAAPHDAAEQERLFKEFLEWSRKRPKR